MNGAGAVDRCEALVIGAGFGGLGAALTLAEAGVDVRLCEAVVDAGGCAATFRREGYRFEAGATLSAGFAPGQLFHRWIDRHALDVRVDPLDPVVEFRTPDLRLDIPAASSALPALFLDHSEAPRAGLLKFFADQRRVADVLWRLIGETDRLPPWTAAGVLTHAARLPDYATLLPHAGRPLGATLERHGLRRFTPLVAWLDAVCQITLQCGAAEAETPLAFAALDYFARGAGHVRHGLGHFANALCTAIVRAGGEVRPATAVLGLEPCRAGWRVTTRHGVVESRTVVANLLPRALERLVRGVALPAAELRRADALAAGWGAVMLYRAVQPPDGAGEAARHLQLVADPAALPVEGNHVFASISGAADTGRAPGGERTMTVSTHVGLTRLAGTGLVKERALIEEIQARMRATLLRLAPEWGRVTFERTASPRTFERFTRRPGGAVGGLPRRAGWSHYREWLRPVEPLPGLFLVGDSGFPGQSTLAAATGGVRVAERVRRRLAVRF